jgi:hypothetical protein
MVTQLSAGVNFSEIDLTTIVPAVSTSVGAMAGVSRWGPVGERILVDSESTLVARIGKPTNFNAETFFVSANFLSYTDTLYFSRAANTTGAVATQTFTVAANSSVTNAIYTVTSGNTSTISAGMYVTQSTNTTVATPSLNLTVTSVINTTAIQLSQATNGNAATTLYFGNPQTSYSALGLEDGTFVSNLVNQIVKNETHYETKDGNFSSGVTWVAKYPGLMGNSLRVAQVDNSASYQSNVALANATMSGTTTYVVGSNTMTIYTANDTAGAFATDVLASLSIGDYILAGNSSIGTQYMKLTDTSGPTLNATGSLITLNFQDPYRLHTSHSTNSLSRYWEFFNAVGVAPGQSAWQSVNGNTSAQDELHVVVVDEGGDFSGTPGTILEVFTGVSRATNAKTVNGNDNYFKNVINQGSRYIWSAADRPNAVSNTGQYLTSSTTTAPASYTFTLGSDGYGESNVALATVASAYDLFASTEDIEVSIIMSGRPLGGSTVVGGQTITDFQVTNYITDNIIAARKDAVLTASPAKSLVLNNFGEEATSLVNYRGSLRDTSYVILDSGYKYQYDRYNDVYRWVPLNGDVAGLCARTDHTNDPWWSPAGFNRGQIKNLTRLAYNPRKVDRDLIYSHGINPVVTFPGEGTYLYGDKTLQVKPSAFDRINVRRLFIVLEKAISLAAKYSLFEFNDTFTRSQFKNLVVPYLRNIQGRRGITDFLVVCDETNNTQQVIDSNQFIGDIYIKPARSINFIQLNFIAVGTNVQFSEVVGRF